MMAGGVPDKTECEPVFLCSSALAINDTEPSFSLILSSILAALSLLSVFYFIFGPGRLEWTFLVVVHSFAFTMSSDSDRTR